MAPMYGRDGFIDAGNVRLHVRVAGDGPAVLFIHGWSLDLEMWDAQLVALSDRYRLIAFDRRGYGLSSGVPRIEDDIDDIDHLLAARGVERVAIVGMSQGARIALRWAIRFRDRTSCLVLDGPPRETPSPGGGEIPIAHYRDLVRREGMDAFRRAWLQHPLMRLRTNDPAGHALLREMIGRYPGLDLMADDELPALHADDLRRFDCPTLIITGEHDSQERRAAGAEFGALLPNAQSAIIPGAGHLANLDNPTAYNELLREFFGRNTAPAATHFGNPAFRAASSRPRRRICD